jgi:hypothetical protein
VPPACVRLAAPCSPAPASCTGISLAQPTHPDQQPADPCTPLGRGALCTALGTVPGSLPLQRAFLQELVPDGAPLRSLRQIGWDLSPRDVVSLMHASIDSKLGGARSFITPFVGQDLFQSAEATATIVKECLEEGFGFPAIQSFFVQVRSRIHSCPIGFGGWCRALHSGLRVSGQGPEVPTQSPDVHGHRPCSWALLRPCAAMWHSSQACTSMQGRRSASPWAHAVLAVRTGSGSAAHKPTGL